MMVAIGGQSQFSNPSENDIEYAFDLLRGLNKVQLHAVIGYIAFVKGPIALGPEACSSDARQRLPSSTRRPSSPISIPTILPVPPVTQDERSPVSSGTDLQVLSWDPATDYKRQLVVSKPFSAGKWQSLTEKFFENIPDSKDRWVEKREAAFLSTEENIIAAIDSIKSSLIDASEVPASRDTEGNNLDEMLHTMGKKVEHMIKATNFATSVSNYSSLVFIAACSVAEALGHPKDSINTAQNAAYPHSRKGDSRDRHLADDRAAVLWLIHEMEHQYRRGLKHRAFEIFLLGKRPIFSTAS